jgi:hypothetical protein
MLAKADVIDRTIIERVAQELSLKPASPDELNRIESHKVIAPGDDRGIADDRTRVAPVNTARPPVSNAAPTGAPVTSENKQTGQDLNETIDIDKILDSLDIE